MRLRAAPLILLAAIVLVSAALAQETRPSTPPAGTSGRITNAEVISLVTAGLSNEVIINAIRAAKQPEFDLTTAGLVSLKKAKVPDSVILAMQDVTAAPSRMTTGVASPEKPPIRSAHVGVYSRRERRGDKPPSGDSIYLNEDGTFRMYHSSKRGDRGTYKIGEDRLIIFNVSESPTDHPPGECLFRKPPGSVRLDSGMIIESDGTEWWSIAVLDAKTDALQKQRAPRTASVTPPVCTGVEMMGLYKNEIFDKAMGGGIVEWLAKIRNNTSVTKIVVFGYIDSGGRQQKSQIQISGGEIVSPRVDMTQSRYIAPVRDLRILSCE